MAETRILVAGLAAAFVLACLCILLIAAIAHEVRLRRQTNGSDEASQDTASAKTTEPATEATA